jgi:hypothetical protein
VYWLALGPDDRDSILTRTNVHTSYVIHFSLYLTSILGSVAGERERGPIRIATSPDLLPQSRIVSTCKFSFVSSAQVQGLVSLSMRVWTVDEEDRSAWPNSNTTTASTATMLLLRMRLYDETITDNRSQIRSSLRSPPTVWHCAEQEQRKKV